MVQALFEQDVSEGETQPWTEDEGSPGEVGGAGADGAAHYSGVWSLHHTTGGPADDAVRPGGEAGDGTGGVRSKRLSK